MAEEAGEGFFDKISDSWNSFLDWSDEKGLPLKNFSLWLEEKGIPSLPAFLILLVAIGALAYFFILAPLQAPRTSSVVITTLSADNAPIPGVSVTLKGAGFDKSTITTADGEALFSEVPIGTFTAAINSPQFVFDRPTLSLQVEEGKKTTAQVRVVSTAGGKVFIYARVEGGISSKILLLDASGQILETKENADAADFSVIQLRTYSVRAEAEGYSADQQEVTVGASDVTKTLYLTKIGEKTKETITIGVFDDAGALGNPITGAKVTVSDASGAILFELTAGEDGIAGQVQLELGTNVTITIEAEGFATKTIQEVFSRENKDFKIRLERATIANAEESVVAVTDNYGNPVKNPIVRLYYLKKSKQTVFVSEQTPGDGSAKFGLDGSKAYFATAFKPGYLPALAEKLEKGKTTVIQLQPVNEENAGSVRVHVTDKTSADVSEASVELLRKDGLPLGIPPRITGIDGVQEFSEVPLVEVKAHATKGSRSAESRLRMITLEGDANENATVLNVQFPPEQGRVEVFAKDYYSEAPVAGASVVVSAGSAASCTTGSDGKCEMSVLESASATARITSTSHEDFESAVFAVLPNVLNKKEFSLQPRGIQATVKLQFLGVFDADGNKVSSLNPFETYDARYILTAPAGLNFSKAAVHVRIGGQDSPIDGEPAVIAAYDAPGATGLSRGFDYSAASSFTPTTGVTQNGQVMVSDKGFAPQMIDVDEGAAVTWKVEGNLTHAILSDDGGFGSNALKAGGLYSRSFPKAGVFSYRDSLHPEFTGTINVRAKQVQQTTTQTASGAHGFKWVEFEFPQFRGSKELRVQIKTVAAKGTASLSHRSAFVTQRGTIRSPEDAEAGVGKSELLAAVEESGRFDISFKGVCQDNVCVQYYFEQDDAQSQNDFEALYPDDFRLHVKIATDSQTNVELSTDSEAIELKNSQGDLSTTSASATKVSASIEKSGEGFFTIKPKKLSEGASLSLKVGTVERQLRVRIASKSAPVLRPEVYPKQLTALDENEVRFRVKDSLGFDVDDALVTVGSETDSVGTQVQATSTGKPGEYSASVQPKSAGFAFYSIEKQGLRKATGQVPVIAPAEFFEATPDAIQITLSGQQPANAQFSLSNKLNNEVQVTLSLSLQSSAAFTSVRLASENMRLKKLEAGKQNTLAAVISEDVLQIAEVPKTLSEKVTGRIRISARIGTARQEKEIPFEIASSFSQQGLSELWRTDRESLEFSVSTKKDKEEQKLRVSNSAPYPLLINQETGLDEVSFSPAFIEVPAFGEGEFVVRAKMPSSLKEDCMAPAAEKSGDAVIHASYAGVHSAKSVSLKASLKQEDKCMVVDGSAVQLPVDVSFTMPQQLRSKTNTDGTVTIELPSKERMLFDSSASVSSLKADVPMNSKFFITTSRITRSSNGYDVSFPVEARFLIPADSPIQNSPSGGSMIALPNTIITFPPATVFNTGNSTLIAIVPQNNKISFQNVAPVTPGASPSPSPSPSVSPSPSASPSPSPSPGIDCLANPWLCAPPTQPSVFPPTGLMNPIPLGGKTLKLPVESQLFFPANAFLIDSSNAQNNPAMQNPQFSQYYSQYGQQNLAGYKGILLQNGVQIAFDSQSQLTQQAEGYVLNVPANAPLVVPPQAVVQLSEDSYRVILPVMTKLLYSASIPNPFRDKGVYVVKLDEQTALQFSFNPTPRTEGDRRVITVEAFQAFSVIGGFQVSEFEDQSFYSACDNVFTPMQDVEIQLPQGTTFKEERNGVSAILPACDENARITLTADGKNVYSPPLSKKIIAPDATYSEDTLFIPAGSRIVFKTCEKLSSNGQRIPTNSELREAQYYFREQTAVELPPSTRADSTVFSLSGFKKVRVDTGAGIQELGITDKIKMSPSSTSDFRTSEQDPAKKTIVILPADSKISFIPYCDKTASGVFEVGELAVFFEVIPNPVEFKLNNSALKVEQPLCLKNKGSTDVTVNTPVVEATSDSYNLFPDVLPTNADSMHGVGIYANQQVFTLSSKPEETGADCGNYVITAQVPPAYLVNYGDVVCIKNDVSVMQAEGTVEFPLSRGSARYESVNKLKVQIEINKDEPPCAGQVAEDAEKAVSDLRVNYAEDALGPATGVGSAGTAGGSTGVQFSFKDSGHTRYLVVFNGFTEDVTLTVTGNEGFLDCVKQEAAGATTQKLQTGYEIPLGEAHVFACTSLKATQWSPITIEAKGKTSGEVRSTKKVNVVVFQPEPEVKQFYSSSPLGRIYPMRESDFPASPTASATPSATPMIQVAGQTALSFQTASPSPSPSPTASATPSATPTTTTTPAIQSNAIDVSGIIFPYCETNFCVYSQALDAYQSFLSTVSQAAINAAPDVASAQRLCNSLITSQWKKQFALHLTNTRVEAYSIADLNERGQAVSQQYSQLGGVENLRSTGVIDELKGCGIYLVEARLNPGMCVEVNAPANAADVTKKFTLQASIRKLVSCNETLQNAPLLMPPDDVYAYTGNEVVSGGHERRGIKFFFGRYLDDQSELDANIATRVTAAMYGSPLPADVLKAGERVETNAEFCKRNLASLHALSNWLIYGGMAWGIAAAFIPGASKTAVLQAVFKAGPIVEVKVAAAKAASTNLKPCAKENFGAILKFTLAVDAAVTVISESLMPGGTGVGRTVLRDWSTVYASVGGMGRIGVAAAGAGLDAAVLAATSHLANRFMPESQWAPPAAYGVGRIALLGIQRRWFTPLLPVRAQQIAAAISAANLELGKVGRGLTPTDVPRSDIIAAQITPLDPAARAQVFQDLLESRPAHFQTAINPGQLAQWDAWYAEGLEHAATQVYRPGTPVGTAVADDFISAVSDVLHYGKVTNPTVFAQSLQSSSLGGAGIDAILDAAFTEAVSTHGISLGLRSSATALGRGPGYLDNIISTLGITRGRAARLRFSDWWAGLSRDGFWGKVRQKVGSDGLGALAGIVAALLIDADGKPVEAALFPTYTNYLLFINYADDFPSLQAYCYYESTAFGSECDEKRGGQLDSNQARQACPAADDACLIVSPLSPPGATVQKQFGAKGYIMGTIANNKDPQLPDRVDRFAQALFNPDVGPLTKTDNDKLIAVMYHDVPQGAISALGEKYHQPTAEETEQMRKENAAQELSTKFNILCSGNLDDLGISDTALKQEITAGCTTIKQNNWVLLDASTGDYSVKVENYDAVNNVITSLFSKYENARQEGT